MPDLAHWLELHATRLRQGLRGDAAYPLPPLAFSPQERELFQLAEWLAETLRPVEPRPTWVASLYERLMGEAHRQHCVSTPSPLLSRWWLGVILGTAALGIWAYRRLHTPRHPGT
ncbi:hypothetical protein [Thermoflexus sp.]|uniref:hypothetical protein n=1 Tax=Thermoflexus sp. TaxID=1969742 RepID=UPI002ADE5763|nr:hypothetical protein [Thermoflexus sp.]